MGVWWEEEAKKTASSIMATKRTSSNLQLSPQRGLLRIFNYGQKEVFFASSEGVQCIFSILLIQSKAPTVNCQLCPKGIWAS